MPHGQSFGYLYPSGINRLVGETLRSRTLDVNSVFDLLQGWNRAVGESRGGGGGSRRSPVVLLGVHTPSKNPP